MGLSQGLGGTHVSDDIDPQLKLEGKIYKARITWTG